MPIRRVAVAIATAVILLGPLVHPTIERFGLLASAAVLCITDTWPLDVPQIWSWTFWGGVWGLVYGFFEKWFPEKFFSYWIVAILFGAIFPTLVLWFVVFPLKGQPIAAGWDQMRIALHLMIHGAWGLGTACCCAITARTSGVGDVSAVATS
jgi:hypothetical protein